MGGKLTRRNDILVLSAKELERFVHLWVARRLEAYVDHAEFGDSMDMGRDVVGFVTTARHEGEWDNYQCKMLAKPLDEGAVFEELGKILFFASEGSFTPPRRYFFVAPKGFNRGAEGFLNNPTKLKATMLAEWDSRCAKRIKKGQSIAMTPALRKCIENFSFADVVGWDIDKILTLPDIQPVLVEVFGDDPGEPPKGKLPDGFINDEAVYIGQLVSIYSDRAGRIFSGPQDVLADDEHGEHLTMQRRRYFDADSFRRHFRDNLDPMHLDRFNSEVFAGVFDTYSSTTGFERLTEVITLAGKLEVGGVFGRHRRASVQVRQGTCHHFANEGLMPWTKL